MKNTMYKNKKAEAVCTVVCFALSQSLILNLLTLLKKWIPNYEYLQCFLQVLFGMMYVFCSIFFTDDHKRGRAFLDEHPKVKEMTKHILTVVINICAYGPHYCRSLLRHIMYGDTLSGEIEIKQIKNAGQESLKRIDSDPIDQQILICILFFALVCSAIFLLLPENILNYATAGLNTIIQFVGVFFVYLNIKDKGSTDTAKTNQQENGETIV